MLLERVRQEALSRLAGARIERAAAGRVAVALLSDGRLGVSAMLSAGLSPAGGSEAARRLRGSGADAAAGRLGPDSGQLERSLSLAVINAAASPREIAGLDAGSLPLPAAGDTVTVIGYIRPVIEAVNSRAARLWVFDDGRSEDVLPQARQRECLAASDLVYVTGSSFANATIDGVARAASRARELVIVGPSTPLYPRAFAGSPVTMLAGSYWNGRDADEVVRLCEGGAGMHDLGAHMVKVWLRLPR